MTDKKQVLKLDGSIEVFDPQKIKRVVCAAGLTNEQGEKLIATVSDFIYSMGENPVSSEIIRDKVYEELKKASSYTAGLFAWYEKTKEKNNNLQLSKI